MQSVCATCNVILQQASKIILLASILQNLDTVISSTSENLDT